MKAFCLHWTGGTNQPSKTDLARYHSFSALKDGKVLSVEGDKPPEANRTINGRLDPGYVRHCGGHNSDTIGHALCGMGGKDVTERPLKVGRYPVTKAQWNHAVRECADYIEIYKFPIRGKTVFLHSEVRRLFGVGKYKWDVNYCKGLFDKLVTPKVAGDRFRADVKAELARRNSKPSFLSSLFAAIANMFKKG